MRLVLALLCLLPVCLPLAARAQQTSSAAAKAGALAPTEQTAARTLSGVVTDADGALLPGAEVTLRSGSERQTRSVMTDGVGHFSFSDVTVGPYVLTVTAEGMETATERRTLNADESVELPPIALRAAVSEEVEVSPLSQQEIAEKQIKVEEKQRLAGLVPNFYVTYDWNAAPLTSQQKFKLAVRSIVDPATFVIVGGFAGIEQAMNSFSGYGQGAAGYGKRYGAGLADTTIGAFLGGYILPSLFHQDPRFFYKGTGSIHSRILYALSTAVIVRGDNGKWQPAYAGILGDFGSGAISNLYYPASNRNGIGLTMVNGSLAVVSDGLGNLLQEFVLKKLTSGLKRHGTPQP